MRQELCWRLVSGGLAAVAMVFPGGGAEAQEYLRAEAPVPESLADRVSTAQQVFTGPKEVKIPESPLIRRLLTGVHGAVPRLTPFGRDEVLTLAPRMYHRRVGDRSGGTSYEAAYGGALGLVSGWLGRDDLAFRFGGTGYLSEKIAASDDGGQGLGLLRPGGQGYSSLGEMFLEGKVYGSSWVAFRRAINLPFININDSRMTPNTFEQYGVRFAQVPGLTVGVGHIAKMKSHTSSTFEPMSSVAGAEGSDHGVSLLGFQWEPKGGVHFAAIDEYGWHTFNTAFVEADVLWRQRGDWDLRLGLQFADQRSVGDELVGDFDAQFGAARLSLGNRGFIASLAATASSGQHSIRNPWGGHPSYNSLMISNFDRAGEKSVRLGLTWNGAPYGLENWSGFASYAFGDARDVPDQHEVDATVDYRVTKGYSDGLWIRARAAWNGRDGQGDRTDIRIVINYAFDF